MAFDSEPTSKIVDLGPQELRSPLQRLGSKMTFGRDEEIYAQEEDETGRLFEVVSGAVRATRVSDDGRRQIVAFYYPGDVFGIEQGRFHRFSTEALCETVIMVASRKMLARAAGEEAFEAFLARATARELERAQDHLLMMGGRTACERVASFLHDLARRTGPATIALPMGRQDIADYLGLTIETVSRMVTQLQTGAIVEFPSCRQFVVRNQAALRRMAA